MLWAPGTRGIRTSLNFHHTRSFCTTRKGTIEGTEPGLLSFFRHSVEQSLGGETRGYAWSVFRDLLNEAVELGSIEARAQWIAGQ